MYLICCFLLKVSADYDDRIPTILIFFIYLKLGTLCLQSTRGGPKFEKAIPYNTTKIKKIKERKI